jgi:hypothetical protein
MYVYICIYICMFKHTQICDGIFNVNGSASITFRGLQVGI